MLFLLALSLQLYVPLWIPTWHFQAFAPYLMFLLHREKALSFLWRLWICGLCMDLLSSSTYFGLTPLIYTLVGGFLYSQRHHFFVDKWPTLPLLAAIFTSFATAGAALFEALLEGHLSFSWQWVFTDLLQMPLIESGFTLVFFSFPFQLRETWRNIQTKRRLRV